MSPPTEPDPRPGPAEASAVAALACPGRAVVGVDRIGRDRGVFSVVHRVALAGEGPTTVVVKAPIGGPNGTAAVAAGAYRREALAYRSLLPASPVAAPACLLIEDQDPDRPVLVLEDLGRHRAVDQVEGLDPDEVEAVVDALAGLHRHWEHHPGLATLPVRRAAPAALDPSALERGRSVLDERWAEVLDDRRRGAVDALLAARAPLVAAFTAAGPATLCHGDPRADNLVLADHGAVLFDWQQLAVQFPEADLAWLLATSTEPETRRRIERRAVERHADATGHDHEAAWERYRLGLVLPGLAVLLLAQRRLDGARSAALVAASLRRIATAVDDLDVADLVR